MMLTKLQIIERGSDSWKRGINFMIFKYLSYGNIVETTNLMQLTGGYRLHIDIYQQRYTI
jgi:hypothetical protein